MPLALRLRAARRGLGRSRGDSIAGGSLGGGSDGRGSVHVVRCLQLGAGHAAPLVEGAGAGHGLGGQHQSGSRGVVLPAPGNPLPPLTLASGSALTVPPPSFAHLSSLSIRPTYFHVTYEPRVGSAGASGGGASATPEGLAAPAGAAAAAAADAPTCSSLLHPLLDRLHPLQSLPVHFGGIAMADVVTDAGGARLLPHAIASAVRGTVLSLVLHPVATLRGLWYALRVALAPPGAQ
jgi:hypothetical protein